MYCYSVLLRSPYSVPALCWQARAAEDAGEHPQFWPFQALIGPAAPAILDAGDNVGPLPVIEAEPYDANVYTGRLRPVRNRNEDPMKVCTVWSQLST